MTMKTLLNLGLSTIIGTSLTLSYGINTKAATTITIDPGDVGDFFDVVVIDFDDLDGIALDGNVLELDFVFNDMKHLEILSPSSYQVLLQLELNSPLTPPGDPNLSIDGFLSDENGNSIAEPDFTSTFITGLGLLEYTLSFSTIPDNFIHHDVHFNIELPNEFSNEIVNSNITFSDFSSGFNNITVGEWEKTTPEPSTILSLITIGGIVLGASRKKQS